MMRVRDGVAEYLGGLSEPYRVLFNEERKGFAINNNLAAQEARGEFLCFLNNDVFVEGDWLPTYVDLTEGEKGCRNGGQCAEIGP